MEDTDGQSVWVRSRSARYGAEPNNLAKVKLPAVPYPDPKMIPMGFTKLSTKTVSDVFNDPKAFPVAPSVEVYPPVRPAPQYSTHRLISTTAVHTQRVVSWEQQNRDREFWNEQNRLAAAAKAREEETKRRAKHGAWLLRCCGFDAEELEKERQAEIRKRYLRSMTGNRYRYASGSGEYWKDSAKVRSKQTGGLQKYRSAYHGLGAGMQKRLDMGANIYESDTQRVAEQGSIEPEKEKVFPEYWSQRTKQTGARFVSEPVAEPVSYAEMAQLTKGPADHSAELRTAMAASRFMTESGERATKRF